MSIDKMQFDDFVGNTEAISQIKLLAADAFTNSGKLPHMGFFGAAGHGKAQPLDSLVLTPGGFIKMRDITVGRIISSPDGLGHIVQGVYPQGKIDVFRVNFTDGTSAECSKDHLWLTRTVLDRDAGRNGSVKTTEKILKSLRYGSKRNHSIPLTKPVIMDNNKLLIHPYVLGCLLGDGYLPKIGSVSISSKDEEIINTIRNLIDFSVNLKRTTRNRYDYRFTKRGKFRGNNQPNKVRASLISLNLIGKKSNTKFIPKIYLNSDIENRLSLLRGLMDTDGTVKVQNKGNLSSQISFSSISLDLAKGVKFLVESLGGVVKISSRYTYFVYKGLKKRGQKSYRVNISMPNGINPFLLKRKAEKVYPRTKYPPTRYIDSIEYIGKKECQCISVGGNGLYITNNFIVTHNTTMARIVSNYVKRQFVYINSVAVKNSMTFRGILMHPENNIHGAVILLDECHRLSTKIRDNLLSVLEYPATLVTSYRNQIIRDKLPDQISFIFATTHAGKMRDAFLSRLEIIEFHEYSVFEKQLIAAKYLKREHNFHHDLIEVDAITEIGRRARNGRNVVKICDNMMRFMKYKGIEKLDLAVVDKVFAILNIDSNGLTKRDRLYLGYLAETGQCGLDTLEAYLNIPKRDIKDKLEPYLLRQSLVLRQSSGRTITPKGMKATRGERVDV